MVYSFFFFRTLITIIIIIMSSQTKAFVVLSEFWAQVEVGPQTWNVEAYLMALTELRHLEILEP